MGGFAVALVAFVSAFPILAVLGGDFMPDFNRGEYQVSFGDAGATLRETDGPRSAGCREAAGDAGVEHTYDDRRGRVSSIVPSPKALTHVKLKPHSGGTFSEVLREARHQIEQVPGLTFGLTEAGAFGQKPIQISVRGPEIDALDRISRSLVAAMRDIPGTADIENSLEKSKPELRVQVDRQRASDLGIPVSMIAATMQAGVVGQVATTIQDAAGDNHNVLVAASRSAAVWERPRAPLDRHRQG